MREYLMLFLKGLVVALPSIVAAIGIIINNLRSSSRQRRERVAKYKLDLIEQTYSKYNELCNQFIEFRASFRLKLMDIQEEIVNTGIDTSVSKYCAGLEELVERIVFWATYKRTIMDEIGIERDIDSVASFMIEELEKAIAYAKTLTRTMKLFVVEFYETGDQGKATEKVIEELEKDKTWLQVQEEKPFQLCRKMQSKRDERIKEFSSVHESFTETEKITLLSQGDSIVDCYAKALEEGGVSKLDAFENRIVAVVREVLKY